MVPLVLHLVVCPLPSEKKARIVIMTITERPKVDVRMEKEQQQEEERGACFRIIFILFHFAFFCLFDGHENSHKPKHNHQKTIQTTSTPTQHNTPTPDAQHA